MIMSLDNLVEEYTKAIKSVDLEDVLNKCLNNLQLRETLGLEIISRVDDTNDWDTYHIIFSYKEKYYKAKVISSSDGEDEVARNGWPVEVTPKTKQVIYFE